VTALAKTVWIVIAVWLTLLLLGGLMTLLISPGS
jgi:hypothetical protein